MSVIRQIAKRILATCVGRDRLLLRGPRSAGAHSRIALTFDDGPHPEYTPRLLDKLDELGLRATFFVIGQKAEQYPQIIHRMADTGHEVANHTWSHSEPGQTSAVTFLDEIQRTDELLRGLTGQISLTVRPPKGELNWTKLNGLWRDQKTVALWNVDPKDFRMNRPEEMEAWCQTYRPHDGDIVLMHDNHPYALRAIERMQTTGVFERFKTTTIHAWCNSSNEQQAAMTQVTAR